MMVSAPQMKVKVRLGAGSWRVLISFCSVRATSSWCPTPEALSQAPGSCRWPSRAMRSSAFAPLPGISAISVRSGLAALYGSMVPIAMPFIITGPVAAASTCSR